MLWDRLNKWAVKQSRTTVILEEPPRVPPRPAQVDYPEDGVIDWIVSIISLVAWLCGYRHYANHHHTHGPNSLFGGNTNKGMKWNMA